MTASQTTMLSMPTVVSTLLAGASLASSFDSQGKETGCTEVPHAVQK